MPRQQGLDYHLHLRLLMEQTRNFRLRVVAFMGPNNRQNKRFLVRMFHRWAGYYAPSYTRMPCLRLLLQISRHLRNCYLSRMFLRLP